jgi:hypothetical protein
MPAIYIVSGTGGATTVYSEPGKGTTFKVFLPRIEEKTLLETKEAVQALPPGNERKALSIYIRAFVMKPFVMRDVAEAIRKVLNAEGENGV